MSASPGRQAISVTYSSTPNLQSYLPFILKSLHAQFPLRNLHWKTPSRPAIRTIQECNLRLVNLIDAQSRGDVREWIAPDEVEYGNLLSQCPLIHICFIECEDNDAYKASCRPYLNTWISSIPAMQHSHKVIVLVNTPTPPGHKTSESKGGVFGNIRSAGLGNTNSAVLSKMKADFEVGSKERPADTNPTRTRCISLTLPQNAVQAQPSTVSPDPTLFVDLLQALKESILGSIDSIVTERESVVLQNEAYIHSPPSEGGWNFKKYFLTKECLACSFENLGLVEDALRVYDELEESLAVVMREHLAWIGRPGMEELTTDEQLLDTQADWQLVSLQRQQDRQKISSGDLSVFSLRCFLFRRQSEMLHSEQTVNPIVLAQGLIQRGVTFISSVGRWLRSHKTAEPRLIEAWIYDASHAVDEASIELSRRQDPNSKEERRNGFTGLNRVRTELLNLAVLQLDRTGLAQGFLPAEAPFKTSDLLMPQQDSVLFDRPDASPAMTELANSTQPESRQAPGSALRVLTRASKDNQVFQSLYDSAIDRARQAEIGAGRVRGKQVLDEKIAANAYFHELWQVAYETYLDLAQQYKADEARMTGPADAKWTSLRMHALSRALDCHVKLSLPLSRTYSMLALEFLKVYAECVDTLSFQPASHVSDAERKTVDNIVQSWEAPPHNANLTEMEIMDHPLFSLSLADDHARPLSHEDGFTCTISISNFLPLDITLSGLHVFFSAGEFQQLQFTADSTTLQTGINHVDVTCRMPFAGVLRMESATLFKDLLAFEYLLGNQPDRKAALVHVPRDPLAVRATAKVARHVSLDSEPYFDICLESGRNQIANAVVSVSCSRNDIRFRTHVARIDTDLDILPSRQNIQITAMPKECKTSLSIPYASAARIDFLSLDINVEYSTVEEPNLRRVCRETCILNLALPIAVNVQDFFRPECLVSKFTVSSATDQAVKMISAELSDADTGYDVQSFNTESCPTCITAENPVPYLFKITKDQRFEPQTPSAALLKLTLTYSIAGEELESIVQSAIQDSIDVAAYPVLAREVCEHVMRALLQEDRLARYVSRNRIELPALAGHVPANVALEIQKLEPILANLDVASANSGGLRTLTVPVEIPSMQAIFTSQITFPSTSPFIVGQPIEVHMACKSSENWALGKVQDDAQVIYDVVVDKDSWLVTGKKRGTFTIAASHDRFEVPVTLIPLRHGLLPYPSVIIQPAPPTTAIPSHEQRPEQQTPLSFENHQIDAARQVKVHPAAVQQVLVRVVREVKDEVPAEGVVA